MANTDTPLSRLKHYVTGEAEAIVGIPVEPTRHDLMVRRARLAAQDEVTEAELAELGRLNEVLDAGPTSYDDFEIGYDVGPNGRQIVTFVCKFDESISGWAFSYKDAAMAMSELIDP